MYLIMNTMELKEVASNSALVMLTWDAIVHILWPIHMHVSLAKFRFNNLIVFCVGLCWES